MVDFINDRQQNRSFLDALSFGYGFGKKCLYFTQTGPNSHTWSHI